MVKKSVILNEISLIACHDKKDVIYDLSFYCITFQVIALSHMILSICNYFRQIRAIKSVCELS